MSVSSRYLRCQASLTGCSGLFTAIKKAKVAFTSSLRCSHFTSSYIRRRVQIGNRVVGAPALSPINVVSESGIRGAHDPAFVIVARIIHILIIRYMYIYLVYIMWVLSFHLFWTSDLWTHQPRSHRRKVTQNFSTFLLRGLP